MGHKVNPVGMRLQINRTWDSRWYADTKDYGDLLLEDIKIREFKTITGVVSFLIGIGFSHADVPLEEGQRTTHKLAATDKGGSK